MPSSVWAIVVAGGDGRRFGRPKQFATLGDRRVVEWSLDAAGAAVDGVVLVLPSDVDIDPALRARASAIVVGGTTRSASVRAGLSAVPETAEIVVVHDAARPLASAELFARVIDAVRAGADGAVPGIAVSDTIKRRDPDGRVIETLERTELVAVQTPQAFRCEALRRAHAANMDATDDAALVEGTGCTVIVVTGEPDNLKLTDLGDLAVLEGVLEGRAAAKGGPGR